MFFSADASDSSAENDLPSLAVLSQAYLESEESSEENDDTASVSSVGPPDKSRIFLHAS